MFLNWTATPPRIGIIKSPENNIEILPLAAGQNRKYSHINVRLKGETILEENIGTVRSFQQEEEQFAEQALQCLFVLFWLNFCSVGNYFII